MTADTAEQITESQYPASFPSRRALQQWARDQELGVEEALFLHIQGALVGAIYRKTIINDVTHWEFVDLV